MSDVHGHPLRLKNKVDSIPLWLLPAAAGVTMFVPKPWDIAIEREVAVAAIRRICRDRGHNVSDGAAAACNQRIMAALTRGYRGNWALNAGMAGSYVFGPRILNGVLTAGLLHFTRRVVEHHLDTHDSLSGLTEEVIRESLLGMLRPGASKRA